MQSDAVDLSERAQPADLPELMDGPCSYEDFRACLHSIGRLNRLSFAYRPTLNFLERAVAMRVGAGSLRILDVGSGGGDMLRRIERWAKAKAIAVELTGVDLNPYATQAAREEAASGSGIQWITGDALSYGGPVDVVISSLLTHHLSDPEIVRFVRWMEERTRLGWFINDLAREARPHRWIGRIARIMGWHRFVQHDGPVSFRRAFREDDWMRLLARSGVEGGELRRWTPARLCVTRLHGDRLQADRLQP